MGNQQEDKKIIQFFLSHADNKVARAFMSLNMFNKESVSFSLKYTTKQRLLKEISYVQIHIDDIDKALGNEQYNGDRRQLRANRMGYQYQIFQLQNSIAIVQAMTKAGIDPEILKEKQ